jgi:hypothetical protein
MRPLTQLATIYDLEKDSIVTNIERPDHSRMHAMQKVICGRANPHFALHKESMRQFEQVRTEGSITNESCGREVRDGRTANDITQSGL